MRAVPGDSFRQISSEALESKHEKKHTHTNKELLHFLSPVLSSLVNNSVDALTSRGKALFCFAILCSIINFHRRMEGLCEAAPGSR